MAWCQSESGWPAWPWRRSAMKYARSAISSCVGSREPAAMAAARSLTVATARVLFFGDTVRRLAATAFRAGADVLVTRRGRVAGFGVVVLLDLRAVFAISCQSSF